MVEPVYRRAPAGFTLEQWEQFERDGYLVIENALGQDEVEQYLAAIDRCLAKNPKYDPARFFGPENVVEIDPAFTELIDHPRHVGFAYDIYGEQLKLHQSQYFLRPRDGVHNQWHPDGARALPYSVFCQRLPLQLKFGYWLTDLPRPKMGNLVVLPGSHRSQYLDQYDTHESVPGERIVCVPRGAMTLMHCSVWHRVEPNESDVTRRNIFLAYCPSWLHSADRFHSDPAWLETLNREQRILMRSYKHSYANAKPPAEDFPLFLDRETGVERDEGMYREDVKLHRRKRLTTVEKWAAEGEERRLAWDI